MKIVDLQRYRKLIVLFWLKTETTKAIENILGRLPDKGYIRETTVSVCYRFKMGFYWLQIEFDKQINNLLAWR